MLHNVLHHLWSLLVMVRTLFTEAGVMPYKRIEEISCLLFVIRKDERNYILDGHWFKWKTFTIGSIKKKNSLLMMLGNFELWSLWPLWSSSSREAFNLQTTEQKLKLALFPFTDFLFLQPRPFPLMLFCSVFWKASIMWCYWYSIF